MRKRSWIEEEAIGGSRRSRKNLGLIWRKPSPLTTLRSNLLPLALTTHCTKTLAMQANHRLLVQSHPRIMNSTIMLLLKAFRPPSIQGTPYKDTFYACTTCYCLQKQGTILTPFALYPLAGCLPSSGDYLDIPCFADSLARCITSAESVQSVESGRTISDTSVINLLTSTFPAELNLSRLGMSFNNSVSLLEGQCRRFGP